MAWSYDNDFAVTQENVCDALGNCQPVFYDYDTDKLLITAGNLTLARDAGNGLVTGTTASNINDSWSYNGFGEPLSYQAQFLTTPLFGQSYTRDAGGRIAQKSETISGVTSVFTYGYDTAGRLTTVTKDGSPLSSYTYDTNGNRLTKGTEVGVYDTQDRLVSYNGATYSYTANGELQSKADLSGTTTYSYDEMGNLLSVTKPDGTLIEYIIDAQNRRVGKNVNGTVVRQYLYSDALRIAAELDGKGALISTFTYATSSNVPDLMLKNGVNYRFTSDRRASSSTSTTGRSRSGSTTTNSGSSPTTLIPASSPSASRAVCTMPTPSLCGSGQGTMTRKWGGGRRRMHSILQAATQIYTDIHLPILSI